ncbi:MAG: hypothetical protein Q4D29_00450 [Lachnospiraceae bacterium]|nr:hypothetical protein [Lachnospiraceae bacterium]
MNELINVDMKIVENDMVVDLRFDRKMSVFELAERVCVSVGIEFEDCYVFSARCRRLLSKNKSFYDQGILGGDTLILIVISNREGQ